MVPGGEEILLVNEPNDIVDRGVVDGDTGVTALGKEHRKLLHGDGIWGGNDIHPRGKDLLYLHVVKLNGGADQFTFMVFQPALALGLVHHGNELFLGDALLLLGVEELDHQLWKRPKNRCRGVSTTMQIRRGVAARMQNRSAWSFARVLG